jgi:hypothetical protein
VLEEERLTLQRIYGHVFATRDASGSRLESSERVAPFDQYKGFLLGPNMCFQCILINVPLRKQIGTDCPLCGRLENALAGNVRGW